ncbi:MAG: hypothetical protein ACKOU6_17170, partial [Planctomycetota bacterium]
TWLERGETLARERRVDGIVYNAQDHFPILAEFKTGNDKNPFHALLQLIMYAAELAAPVRWHPAFFRSAEQSAGATAADLPSDTADIAKTAETASAADADDELTPLAGPLLDIYIILGDYDDGGAAHREMLDVTAPFCQRLFQDRSITNYLRRVACLNTRRTESGLLTCHKIFAFPDLDLAPAERARLN